jgi:hypothetical protein
MNWRDLYNQEYMKRNHSKLHVLLKDLYTKMKKYVPKVYHYIDKETVLAFVFSNGYQRKRSSVIWISFLIFYFWLFCWSRYPRSIHRILFRYF